MDCAKGAGRGHAAGGLSAQWWTEAPSGSRRARPRGQSPKEAAGGRGKRDAGALAGLAEVVGMAGALVDEDLAVAGEVAEVADGRWRHEAGRG